MKAATGIFSPVNKSYNNWAPLFLRLAMGIGFMVHGYAKLSRGPMGFGRLLAFSGIPMPNAMAWIGSVMELAGGAALIAGILVSLISVPLIVTMLTAIFTVQYKYGFSSVKTIGLNAGGPVFGPPGYEINVIYIAGLIALIILGAGPLSLDAWLSKRRKGFWQ